MIQLLIIIVGILVLAAIFFRRYMATEKGVVAFQFHGRRKNIFDYFHFILEKGDDLEITVDELIPDKSMVDPKNVTKAEILSNKADASINKGDIKNAQKFLIQSLALDPSNLQIYHKLGLLYLRQGQFSKAENMYRKLILSLPTDPVFNSNLGLALYQQKKLEEAKSFYQKAIELDNTRAGRFFSLGQILNELGEFEHALDHLRKAIELDSRNLDYLLTLAQVYSDRDMAQEAQQLLGEILALYPDNVLALEMMQKVQKPKQD